MTFATEFVFGSQDCVNNFAIHLASKHFIAIYTYDGVSQGKSEGESEEYFSEFSFLVDDLKSFVEITTTQNLPKQVPFLPLWT